MRHRNGCHDARAETIGFFDKPVLAMIMTLFAGVHTHAQIIVNAYARVTGIQGDTLLYITNVDETNHTFTVGEEIIIMEMNVANMARTSPTFNWQNIPQDFPDDPAVYRTAGLYEKATIRARNANAITLASRTINKYTFSRSLGGVVDAVQIVSYRKLGTPDYTTIADITAPLWNFASGTGGVVALHVPGKLILRHNISVDGKGYAGGGNTDSPPASCINLTSSDHWISTSNPETGGIGDGFTQYPYAFAASSGSGNITSGNGGGGGFGQLGAGGGGGNYAPGGIGNVTATGTCYSFANGTAGWGLRNIIRSNRIFMGGGGGSGVGAGATGKSGGQGGGIVLITAKELVTTSGCTVRSITANGEHPATGTVTTPNVAPGGAGAGGTIHLNIEKYTVSPGCQVRVSANGGAAGRYTDGESGAGGQGYIHLTHGHPGTSTVTFETRNGASPCAVAGACPFLTIAPPVIDNAGITGSLVSPLPVTLLYFRGVFDKSANTIHLQWTTVTEYNNSHFTVERSMDGIHFSPVAILAGQTDSRQAHTYRWDDDKVYEPRYYYRLIQTDLDGKQEYFNVIVVDVDRDIHPEVYAYPNPAGVGENIYVDFVGLPKGQYLLKIVGMDGREVMRQELAVASAFRSVVLKTLGTGKGIYAIILSSGEYSQSTRILFR